MRRVARWSWRIRPENLRDPDEWPDTDHTARPVLIVAILGKFATFIDEHGEDEIWDAYDVNEWERCEPQAWGPNP